MKHIPLRNSDLKVKVDDADYEVLSQYTWTLKEQHGRKYALRGEHGNTVYMHREILGLRKGDRQVTDHINFNGLDNRRKNLRIATISQNSTFSKRSGLVEGYHGIKKLRCGAYVTKKKYEGGTKPRYSSAKAAAKAWDKLEKEKRGQFAYLNFKSKKNSYNA